jgi:hypothetical protein
MVSSILASPPDRDVSINLIDTEKRLSKYGTYMAPLNSTCGDLFRRSVQMAENEYQSFLLDF